MSEPKLISGVVALIGIIGLGLILFLTSNRPATSIAAGITPPPRTPVSTPVTTDTSQSGNGSDSNGTEDPGGAISGQVIDLSTGLPAQGIEVNVSGRIITTNQDGHYSLTGLETGTYEVSLRLPSEATPTQKTWVVIVGNQEALKLDLSYYSQTAPTATPTPLPTRPAAPTATPTPTEISNLIPPLGGGSQPSVAPSRPIISPPIDEPLVWIKPGHINNELGTIGNINVDVANVSDFGAFQATLTFDPTMIEVQKVTLGEFLDRSGRDTTPLVTDIDNVSGQISFMVFTAGQSEGPDGNGTLAIVNFISKRSGFSALDLRNVGLFSSLGDKIPVSVGGALVQTTACFGDLNADKVVDVGDIQIVAGRINQTLGNLNYALEYDINSDGVINNIDVALVTERLNNRCP
jgi:hypothetical protein